MRCVCNTDAKVMAQRLAQQISIAKAETTDNKPGKLAVNMVQSYLLSSSFIKAYLPKESDDDHTVRATLPISIMSVDMVADHYVRSCVSQQGSSLAHMPAAHVYNADKERKTQLAPRQSLQDSLENRQAARQLGYYLFWFLRSYATTSVALHHEEVIERVTAAGLPHPERAWALLDRNGDNSVTLEEVISAVEQARMFPMVLFLPASLAISACFGSGVLGLRQALHVNAMCAKQHFHSAC